MYFQEEVGNSGPLATWNTVTAICLHNTQGCFCATAEWKSYKKVLKYQRHLLTLLEETWLALL